MRITIAGTGFTGSVLAIELARSAASGVDICLGGIASSCARGVAYGDARRPEHLLNRSSGHCVRLRCEAS